MSLFIESIKIFNGRIYNLRRHESRMHHINELYVQKGECDDIIIAKDGMLTDSSYSNIALLQNGKWYTPTTCLLKGTRREQLIDQGRLVEREISVDDIGKYESVCLINAMMGLGQLRINSSQIV